MFRHLLQSPAIMLKFIASLLYIVMGGLLLTVKDMVEGLGSGFSISLGCVLLIYGIFRFYRAYLDLKEIARKE